MKTFQLALLAALSATGTNAFSVNLPTSVATSSTSSSTFTPTIGGRGRSLEAPSIVVRYAAAAESSEDDKDDEATDTDDSDDANEESEDEETSTDSSSTVGDEPSDVNSELSMDDAGSDRDADKVKTETFDGTGKTMQKLLELSARTGRGEFASQEERHAAMDLVQVLEGDKTMLPGVAWNEKMYGRWELVYSSTELFRSSPFFMAARAVCTTDEQTQQYNWFCEMHRKSLAISTIGSVRQIVSPSRLISEFEVSAGAIPFLRKFSPFSYSGGLPVAIQGAIVSTADIDTLDEGDAWEISMDTVEIKGSNMPGLRQLLDSGLKLESRQLGTFLENNLPNYSNPKPIFETTYLDDRIRVSRDQDNNVFVYSKVSDVMEATDYSSVMPDLGVTRLLEGFNDSVSKIYL